MTSTTQRVFLRFTKAVGDKAAFVATLNGEIRNAVAVTIESVSLAGLSFTDDTDAGGLTAYLTPVTRALSLKFNHLPGLRYSTLSNGDTSDGFVLSVPAAPYAVMRPSTELASAPLTLHQGTKLNRIGLNVRDETPGAANTDAPAFTEICVVLNFTILEPQMGGATRNVRALQRATDDDHRLQAYTSAASSYAAAMGGF